LVEKDPFAAAHASSSHNIAIAPPGSHAEIARLLGDFHGSRAGETGLINRDEYSGEDDRLFRLNVTDYSG